MKLEENRMVISRLMRDITIQNIEPFVGGSTIIIIISDLTLVKILEYIQFEENRIIISHFMRYIINQKFDPLWRSY